MDEAKGLNTTLHRVVDRISNLLRAIGQAIELGFDRILTSSGAQDAETGVVEIAKIMRHYAATIIIMPGGGINAKNVGKIGQITNASGFHGFRSIEQKEPTPNLFTQKSARIASADEVRKIKAALKTPNKSKN